MTDVTMTHEHVTASVCRDPGTVLRAWCICGWWGPERRRNVHVTLDRKAHLREATMVRTREASAAA